MTLDVLRDSGIGKEVKRVSKSSTSSGEPVCSAECDMTPVYPTTSEHQRPPACPKTELRRFCYNPDFSFAYRYAGTRNNVSNCDRSFSCETQRFETWRQTLLLNGERSFPLGHLGRRLRRQARVSHVSPSKHVNPANPRLQESIPPPRNARQRILHSHQRAPPQSRRAPSS